MSGLSTFFYFVAGPIFPPEFVVCPVLHKHSLACIDRKCLQNACLSSFIVLYT